MKGLNVEDELASTDPILNPEFANGVKFKDPSFGPDFDFSANPLVLPQTDLPVELSPTRIEGDLPTDENVFSETLLDYINQMLMEEDMDQKPCMFHDPLALQAAEKSLHDVLGEDNPLPSPNHTLSYGDQFLVDSPDDGMSSNFSDHSTQSSSSLNTSGSTDHPLGSEFGDPKSSFMQMPLPTNFVFQATAKPTLHPGNSGMASSSAGNFTVSNPFRESELALQFIRGVEEANKFLPKGNQLNINLDTSTFTSGLKVKAPKVEVKIEKEETEYFPSWLNMKKNRERENDEVEEERSNKQSAVYYDETGLAEMFNNVLVCANQRRPLFAPSTQNKPLEGGKSQQNGEPCESSVAKPWIKRQVYRQESVDLRSILILCAQAVSSDDHLTANKLLKQIRQQSSLLGDGSQRLAHCFANGLEARLAGTGTQIYTALFTAKISAADMLKAFHGYISACPFHKAAIIFANQNILKVAEKATTLHIIDFGILYGFQWPDVIYQLSKREGGPPKLRITGIELPQSGFRPLQRVQDTGRHLAKFCELYKVPFEYNGIAQKWETIRTDDIGILPGETVAVNSLFRFKNLLDETVAISSPRNSVLNLIRKMNPDIFVHAIVNGSYSAPFFVSRFREALFHFSCLFDMLDCNTTHEDPMRLKYEKEFFGRAVMNVLACEGSQRVERPETYKQWQVRSTRTGLKKLPQDPQLMKRVKSRLAGKYHEDFVIDEDSDWLLQGWKGRIVCASSAWVAA